MSSDAVLTLIVIVAVVAALVSERVSPALTILAGVIALLLFGVIDADQAFAGFANPAPLTVAALYVLAAAAGRTRVLETLVARVTVRPGARRREPGERGSLARLLVPTATASAFLNNTPIVAMVIPGVLSWTRRTGRSPSRYLMPVSFAAIAGGTVTLIGTSTNLVVSGLLQDAGYAPLGLWEIGKVGLPFAIAGLITMILLTPLLLPERRAPSETADADAREFTLEMIVTDEPGIAGHSVAEGGLRSLQGVFLVEVERDGHRISSVRPDEILAVGDRLTFAGNVTRVLDLQEMRGLASAQERHFSAAGSAIDRRLYEAVVAPASGLVGQTLKQTGFRGRYGGAVIAIHRAGGHVPGKLGEVPLHAGDVLLVLSGPAFRPRALDRRDFLVVAPLSGDGPPREEKAPLVGLIILALLVLAGTGVMDILLAAFLAAFAVVALRILSPTEARDSVDIDVIVVIAASFGFGRGDRVQRSGGQSRERPGRAIRQVRRPGAAVRRASRDDGADRAHHQQRGRRAVVPGRPQHRSRGGARPAPLRHRHRDRRLVVVPHTDRLPDQHDGLRHRRLPVRRLRAPRPPAVGCDGHRFHGRHTDRVAPSLRTGSGAHPLRYAQCVLRPPRRSRVRERTAKESDPWHTASPSFQATAPGRRSPKPPSASSTRRASTSTGTCRRPASTSSRPPAPLCPTP